MKTITLKSLLSDNNDYNISNIIVPIIQRSYAQGRNDIHAIKTRNRFLKHIREKISAGKNLTLDFIYGNVTENNLIPLEGQQRLTTLWLLHWYAGVKDPSAANFHILDKFTYHTRYSARDFLSHIINFIPSFNSKISEEIRNQGWFPIDWENDPTVRSMMTMIDAIDENFKDIPQLWDKLDNINFYFKNIEDMQLTDDIYIKMNSRGKPLTDFEHVKAEIIRIIRGNDKEEDCKWNITASRIGRKFDIDWTDLLWDYRGEDNNIDNKFLNYMRLVFHLLIYRHNGSVTEYPDDLFELVNIFFTGEDAEENISFFENCFDCWVRIRQESTLDAFFNKYLSITHMESKSIPLERMGIDIFEACINGYPFERQNLNARQWITTLYAFIVYLSPEDTGDRIKEEDFRRRLRIVLNLQKNSWNEVVDNPKADAGNRMPAILRQVERIIKEGFIHPEIYIDGIMRPNFSVPQINEEKSKLEFTQTNPELAPGLYKFEDNPLINGRIEILGKENHSLFERFDELFQNNDPDLIDRALLAIGDYWQGSQRKSWSLQLGSGNSESSIGRKAWFELFHPSENTTNFEKTSETLVSLLISRETIDNEYLNEIAEDYLRQCEERRCYPWKYYYIKYPVFRIKRYGKYYREKGRSYQLLALWTEKKPSQNAYDCFLKAIGEGFDKDVSNMWRLPITDNMYLKNEEHALVVFNESDEETDSLEIPCSDEGIDSVDRVIMGINFIKALSI